MKGYWGYARKGRQVLGGVVVYFVFGELTWILKVWKAFTRGVSWGMEMIRGGEWEIHWVIWNGWGQYYLWFRLMTWPLWRKKVSARGVGYSHV